MRAIDVIRLIMLAAIWGASFLFMRILAPVLGPVVTANARVLIAGVVLCAIFAIRGPSLAWRRHWRPYVVIGIVNSAVPFWLFSWAALHIPASYSATLNATAPVFGMILAVFWLAERPTAPRVLGGVLGMVGVALLTGIGPIAATPAVVGSVLACLAAALCYALAGIFLNRRATELNPVAVAGASQIVAGVALLPPSVAWPPTGQITGLIAVCVLALALLCSAVAYLLYFRLVTDCGPTRALTVTFLIPVFGLLWGVMFLGEKITLGMIAGSGLVIVGAVLVVRRPTGTRRSHPSRS